VEAADRLNVESLNDALLAELLPVGRGSSTVLLGCDDQALAAATARLGISGSPDAALRVALQSAGPITTELGLRRVLAALTEPPDDLIVLCVCVLAASRMHPDEQHSTHAYYGRLCEVLGIAPRDQWPAVAGFERTPARFQALAEWAASEGRGTIALPSHPTPALVGIPISQTLLRRVDRDRLGALFDRHRLALDRGRDPLRLLRADSIRHQLTAPAQRLLDRDDLDVPLRATLDAAYHAWDGTVMDERGRRIAAGTLRLGLSPGRVTLNLSLPHLEAAVELTGADGAEALLPAWPAELTLPAGWLSYASDGPVVAQAAHGQLVRVLPGPTMLFDAADTGFWLTAAAAEGSSVLVLTCAPDLATRDWGHRQARLPLPHGWVLICAVKAEELPEELREPARDDESENGRDIELVGGLALEGGVWLIDHPPLLRSRLEDPVVVEARSSDNAWRELGELEPDEPFSLAALAHRPGTHTVAVGGHEFVFELAQSGLRAGVGELAHRPRDLHLMRAGAVSQGDAERYGDPRPAVCGAAVDGAGDPAWQSPLTLRAQAIVHVLYSDGRVGVASPRPQPQWARQAQLPAHGSWPIPDGEQAVWLCVQSRTHPRVIALRAETVRLTDEVLDIAQWFGGAFADAPIIDRSGGGAEARWRELVDAARADTEELPAHG